MAEDAEAWMNIYGQFIFHSPARIVGTRIALERLRDAVEAALSGTEGEAHAFASDGEGYAIEVRRVEVIAAIGSPEYRYDTDYSVARAEYERNERLFGKPALPPLPTPTEEPKE